MKKTITKLMIATLLCGMMAESRARWSAQPLWAFFSWPVKAALNQYNTLSPHGRSNVNVGLGITCMAAAIGMIRWGIREDLRYHKNRLDSVKRDYQTVTKKEAPTDYDHGAYGMELGVTVLSKEINNHLQTQNLKTIAKHYTKGSNELNREQAKKIRELQSRQTTSTSPCLTQLLLSERPDKPTVETLQRELDQTKKDLAESQKLANFWKQACITQRKNAPPSNGPGATELLRTP